MPEDFDLSELVMALGAVQADLRAVEATAEEQNQLLQEQNRRLAGFVQRRSFRRTVAGLVVAGLLILGFALWAREERQRDAAADRRTAAARAYVNCEAVNRAFHGVDLGYSSLFGFLRVRAEDQESIDRINNFQQLARQGLNRTDCDGHLRQLPPSEAEKVKSESNQTLPTLPLPPPPTR